MHVLLQLDADPGHGANQAIYLLALSNPQGRVEHEALPSADLNGAIADWQTVGVSIWRTGSAKGGIENGNGCNVHRPP